MPPQKRHRYAENTFEDEYFIIGRPLFTAELRISIEKKRSRCLKRMSMEMIRVEKGAIIQLMILDRTLLVN